MPKWHELRAHRPLWRALVVRILVSWVQVALLCSLVLVALP